MVDRYDPEIGQFLWGQKALYLRVPREVECAMDALQATFDTLHPELDSPFGNTGARFKWSCCEVHAYHWGEDDQPFNFKWNDFAVRWYKYKGRGMSCNRKIKGPELQQMLTQCMTAFLNEAPLDCYEAPQ